MWCSRRCPHRRMSRRWAFGENGLVHGFRKGSVWFDLSTNSVSLVREMHAKLAEQGVALLDAPVSGGPRGANSGKLAIWVGGDEAVFHKHKAVLDAMGDQARYIGAIGAGSVAKLVHNLSGAAVNVALAEAFTMGVKAGHRAVGAVGGDPPGCRRAGAYYSIVWAGSS